MDFHHHDTFNIFDSNVLPGKHPYLHDNKVYLFGNPDTTSHDILSSMDDSHKFMIPDDIGDHTYKEDKYLFNDPSYDMGLPDFGNSTHKDILSGHDHYSLFDTTNKGFAVPHNTSIVSGASSFALTEPIAHASKDAMKGCLKGALYGSIVGAPGGPLSSAIGAGEGCAIGIVKSAANSGINSMFEGF